MHASIERLLKVQEVDSQRLFLEEAIRRRPLELEDERRKLSAAEERVAAIEARMKEVKISADQRELDVRGFDKEIEKITVARNQAKSNNEYALYGEQIKRQEGMRSVAEEEVLTGLTELDTLAAEKSVTSTATSSSGATPPSSPATCFVDPG